jgi:hypothetical protein
MSFHPVVINAVADQLNQASLRSRTLNLGASTIVDKVNQDLSISNTFDIPPTGTSPAVMRGYEESDKLGNLSITFLVETFDDLAEVYVGNVKKLKKAGVLIAAVGAGTSTGVRAACAARAVADFSPMFEESLCLNWVSGHTLTLSDDPWLTSKAKTATSLSPLEPEITWLKTAYDLIASGKTAGALRIIYWSIEDLFASRNFLALNHALNRVDVKRLNPEVMVGVIRSTYRGRLVMPAWDSLLEKIKKEMMRRNVPDWARLLVGLEPGEGVDKGIRSRRG